MTVSEDGLYRDLRGFGLTRTEAACIVASLQRDLSRDEMKQLSARSRWVPNETTRGDAVYALMRGADKRTKGALADAGNDCLQ